MLDWHPFDVERGYDVAQKDEDTWLLRDRESRVWELNAEQFNALRSLELNPLDIQ